MSETPDHAQIVERLARARVTCVGDLMLDKYIYGEVSRISPEGPVPVLRVTEQRLALGGVGNVARNLSTLGAKVACISASGEDPAGDMLESLLQELPSCHFTLVRDTARSTTVKTRCIGGHQQMLRLDEETLSELEGDVLEQLLQAVRQSLNESDVLLLSDYGKGVLSQTALQTLISYARDAGVAVVVDPKGPDYRRYAGASVVTPNRSELAQATSLSVDSDEEVVAAASRLIQTCGIESVLVTRSERGMTWVPATGSPVHVPTSAQEVFDVSGAGDTVIAVFAAARGADIEAATATQLANAAAGLAVAKLGTAAVSALELIDALESSRVGAVGSKRLSLDQLLDRVHRWRSGNLRVGFTNGCFDLLHPGHVKLLAEAKTHCDRLIVGLNTDASVRRLKGDTRPIQNETARATILASISHVDALVLFADDTPMTLIDAIKPDVLVKGADYRLEDVVGASTVTGYGGRVELVALLDGQSTSALIGSTRTTEGT